MQPVTAKRDVICGNDRESTARYRVNNRLPLLVATLVAGVVQTRFSLEDVLLIARCQDLRDLTLCEQIEHYYIKVYRQASPSATHAEKRGYCCSSSVMSCNEAHTSLHLDSNSKKHCVHKRQNMDQST